MTDPASLFSQQRVLDDLRLLGFRFHQKRGQNFLFDSNLLQALVRDSGVEKGDRVLEIGPGAGTLTRALLDRGCQVTTMELDGLLCQYLKDRPDLTPLHLIEGDALETKNRLSRTLLERLDLDSGAEGDAGFHLVANLPYSIAAPLVAMLVDQRPEMKRIGVLVQKEMAMRWVARPGTREYGTTTVLLALSGEGKISRTVPAHAFVPPPKVESCFYTWTRAATRPPIPPALMGLMRSCFQQRRKTLGKILRDQLSHDDGWWQQQDLEPTIRPDQLSPQQWASLAMRIGKDSRHG